MNKKISYIITISLFILFIIFTIIVKLVDVKQLGVEGTKIGLSSFNTSIRDNLPFNNTWYKITKYLGVLWFVVCGLFGVYGIYQLIKEKSLKKIDKKLIILFIIYALVILTYILFEFIFINYRPVLLDGKKEYSYPSSHTLLTISLFIPSALYIYKSNFNKIFKIITITSLLALTLIIIIGRFLSGVHWATDILGGIILGSFFVSLYISLNYFFIKKEEPTKEEQE